MGRVSVNKAVESSSDKSCDLCLRKVHDEAEYGMMYTLGAVNCHYFCVLLSCMLIQKGLDSMGIYGFLEADILKEIERGKKIKCVYCNLKGATLACCSSHCKRQFHLPCGRERGVVSLFFGNYPSFCIKHGPKQNIPSEIMESANQRMKAKMKNADNTELNSKDGPLNEVQTCSICYEEVDAFPTPKTFWPPCCARDRWLHSKCVQLMALNAGIHYLKCPLCNDQKKFQKSLQKHGYYIPDRDASWELETNAYSEIYERPKSCSADVCICPNGRAHNTDEGDYDLRICCVCGSDAVHAVCQRDAASSWYVCDACVDSAPQDLETITALQMPGHNEASTSSVVERREPVVVMPSRLSIRRTKPNYEEKPTVPPCKHPVSKDEETPLVGFSDAEANLSHELLKINILKPLGLDLVDCNEEGLRNAVDRVMDRPAPLRAKIMRIRKMIREMNAKKYPESDNSPLAISETDPSTDITENIENIADNFVEQIEEMNYVKAKNKRKLYKNSHLKDTQSTPGEAKKKRKIVKIRKIRNAKKHMESVKISKKNNYIEDLLQKDDLRGVVDLTKESDDEKLKPIKLKIRIERRRKDKKRAKKLKQLKNKMAGKKCHGGDSVKQWRQSVFDVRRNRIVLVKQDMLNGASADNKKVVRKKLGCGDALIQTDLMRYFKFS